MGRARPLLEPHVFATGLPQVYGIAFYPPGPDPRWVYIATVGSVRRIPYRNGDLAASRPAEIVVPSLPEGGAHWTRDLAFSPDGKTMFVSVGSATDDADGLKSAAERLVGLDPERDRADVLAFDPDGGHKRVYATGLRNCSGMAVEPSSAALWCVVNERDGLGDDLPPDYATRVGAAEFFGWPWFYIGDHQDPRHKGERPDLAGRVDRPRRAVPAALGSARHRFLPRRAVSCRIRRRRVCRLSRLLEPRQAHRLQGGAADDEGRQADGRLPGFSGRLRRRPTAAFGAGPSASPWRRTARCSSPTTRAARSGG